MVLTLSPAFLLLLTAVITVSGVVNGLASALRSSGRWRWFVLGLLTVIGVRLLLGGLRIA